MSARDRMVVVVLAAAAILAAAYLGVVSPERKKASELAAKVSEARQSLSAAEAKLTEAKSAQRRYAAAYATIVTLGEAVPADGEVPSLLYELDHIAGHVNVEFQTIAASASSSSASASAASGAEASLTSAGFQQLPFSFTFDGSFFDLYHLMQRLQGLTVSLPSGGVNVKGRLLTIQSVSLSGGGSTAGSSPTSSPKEQQLTGTVTATAYVLPPGEALTAGASPSGPAGTTATASEPTSSTAAAPAVVKAP